MKKKTVSSTTICRPLDRQNSHSLTFCRHICLNCESIHSPPYYVQNYWILLISASIGSKFWTRGLHFKQHNFVTIFLISLQLNTSPLKNMYRKYLFLNVTLIIVNGGLNVAKDWAMNFYVAALEIPDFNK